MKFVNGIEALLAKIIDTYCGQCPLRPYYFRILISNFEKIFILRNRSFQLSFFSWLKLYTHKKAQKVKNKMKIRIFILSWLRRSCRIWREGSS